MGKANYSETFKVGFVTVVCIGIVAFITSQVLYNGIDLAVMGPVLLFLGYLVSEAWTPLPEWNPTLFWSSAIVFTTIVEIAFSYFM